MPHEGRRPGTSHESRRPCQALTHPGIARLASCPPHRLSEWGLKPLPPGVGGRKDLAQGEE